MLHNLRVWFSPIGEYLKLVSRLVCLALIAIGPTSSQTITQAQELHTKQRPEAGKSRVSADPSIPPGSTQFDTADHNSKPAPTFFPHSESSHYWISGQANFILQWHPRFRAPYTGANSLRPEAEHQMSRLFTLYTGYQITKNTEILVAPESTGGRGLSDALGLAGFTNLDVVRNPDLGAKPYISRLMIHQIIPFSSERIPATRGPLSLATELPVRRLEIRLGKIALAEFFDFNSVGTDSHFQFMNWTADNNGAYDYAADTRGYTVGAIFDYEDRNWGLRYGEALMPKIANGLHLDADLRRARAENIELELRRSLIQHRQGALRMLAFINHANMGSYREAVNDFLTGKTPSPDIAAHPLRTTIKYGFGANFEQGINDWLVAYGRWGWNDGRHETYAYTEVDQTVAAGLGLATNKWNRTLDHMGITFVSNGISRDHQTYLALGGRGFLLGDGQLNYGRENIFEAYYTVHIWRGLYGSFDIQHISNPGYNRDRGPVTVPGVRVHLEF